MISTMNYQHLFKRPQANFQGGQQSGTKPTTNPTTHSVQGERGTPHGVNPTHSTQKTTQAEGLENNPKFQAFRAQRNSEVMAHEQAHASAAGAFGGSIHIDYDQNGVAQGGHVPIAMPSMDRANPENTASHAQTVISAATAPGADMSGQDASVAARAQSILGQAQLLMGQKNKKPT